MSWGQNYFASTDWQEILPPKMTKNPEFSHVALVLIDDHRCERLCRGGLTGCRTAACRLGRGAWLMVLPRICCQPRDRPNFGVDIQIIMIAVEFLRQEFRHFIYSSVSIIDNRNYDKIFNKYYTLVYL